MLEHPLRRLESGGRMIAKKLASAPVALLFGSEKFGLSNEDMSYCHWLMRIPAREEHGSMNLGQAVAVCLYEIIRSPSPFAQSRKQNIWQAPRKWSRVTVLLEELLERSGYVNARVEGSTKMKIRRLIRRMDLNAHDAEVWLGMLRQIKWKLLNLGSDDQARLFISDLSLPLTEPELGTTPADSKSSTYGIARVQVKLQRSIRSIVDYDASRMM